MGNLTQALVVVLTINVLLFLGQAVITELNPTGATVFYNGSGGILEEFDSGNNDLNEDYVNKLPTSESSVSPTTGNIFTDTFSTAKNWFLETTGISYIYNMLSAPSNFLKALGLPKAFSFAIGGLWYGVTLFLIIAFIFGRDT